jgi:hypothetical protein
MAPLEREAANGRRTDLIRGTSQEGRRNVSRSLAALLLLVALAGAGCGRANTPVPSSTVAPTTPTASTSPTGAPTRHADPALEALLPDRLGGVTLIRESQRGTDLLRQSDALDAMLSDLGRTLADFTLASAYSPAGEVKAQVGAWRVAGAATDKLVPGLVTAIQASSTTKLTITEASIAGRSVTQIGAPGQLAQGPLYAFARDDIVLFVQTPDPKLAEEALVAIRS